MDNDFNSVSNSTTQGATPAIIPAANNVPASNLRPTTAAAIAMDNDMLMGMYSSSVCDNAQVIICLGNLNNEDLDEDFGMDNAAGNPANVRPNTAGAMLSGNYNRAAAGGAVQTGSSWGYARSGDGAAVMMKGSSGPMLASGNMDYGTDNVNNNRRPHTAHGARAGFPTPGAGAVPATSYGVADPNKQGMMYGEQEEEGDPVVAGARGMMRYRRNRTGAEGPAGSATGAPAGATGTLPSGNVAYGANKPVSGSYGQEQYAGSGKKFYMEFFAGF